MKQFLAIFPLMVTAAQCWEWNQTTIWTTITTDVYTTYCPESTTFTQVRINPAFPQFLFTRLSPPLAHFCPFEIV
jgi:hypothetical protein